MTKQSFRAVPPSALCIEPLGELTAVFDRRSTQTHVMASPLPEILAAMREGSWDPVALTAQLASDFDLTDADPLAVVAERLAELESLGLVERA